MDSVYQRSGSTSDHDLHCVQELNVSSKVGKELMFNNQSCELRSHGRGCLKTVRKWNKIYKKKNGNQVSLDDNQLFCIYLVFATTFLRYM